MEYHSMAQRWEFDPDPKFLYTHVILWDGDDYVSAELQERIACPQDFAVIDQSRLQNLQKIPREHIWPLLDDKDQLTICRDPERSDVYIKQPRLTGYNGSESLSKYLLEEARICQILMGNPHKNVARYLGCVVNDNRITGLCFQKYVETLADRLRNGRSVDNESCLEQVRAGIDHLRAFNLVHNDLHTENVMFADRHSNTPVIIDFDSCAFKGVPLPDKRGEMPEGACTAEFENDDFALERLQQELIPRKHEIELGQKMDGYFLDGLKVPIRYLGHLLKRALNQVGD